MNKFDTKFDLAIKVQYTQTVPVVRIQFDDFALWDGELLQSQLLSFVTPSRPAGSYDLTIQLLNKDQTEWQRFGLDMMIAVERLTIENYDHDFSLYSEYEPEYPEPWYTEQKLQNNTPSKIIHSNYIGWPGIWRLNIELPIFRWIHKRTNQGWLI